ncbi:uncharacterized protein LOC131602110 [Vicia villosa]|uniref:uncharacterized protein LOC131602110 n=1 Tax=Vicia villosa TaxID=3911 RepID=UPI00273CD1BF|nr:uncharacterized protein LOC131602110 [Vicia villosa]XP_058730102.1 uncharacterized protein LOC131602110 [Vicia villosa]
MAREFSEEWKSLFPVGGSTVSPLLFSDPHSIGPIFFNPNPNSLTHLFSSTIPSLSLPHHLLTERYLVSSDPSILPSTASSIATLFDSPIQVIDHNVSQFLHNRIHLLKCRDSPNVVILFPTGANDESIGFFMLCVKDSLLETRLDVKGNVFRASTGSKSRIFRMSVNPVTDSELGGASDSSLVIGYLLASSLYSVCWFTVNHNLNMHSPSMSYLGTSKVFKETVVHACWSPHILEESLVLLESGQLFLFDLESQGSMNVFKGTRLRVPWSDWTGSEENKAWLSCEFSWHPRILIVARCDAVFLVDLRLKECSVTCLMKIETLRMYATNVNERFLALSRAGPDDFYFTVASSSLLVLCDVRKPLMPILQWKHNIDEPCYMNVLSLATLRSHSKVDNFKLASEMGFCIILGSFWNFEFNVFCYGPAVPFRKGSITSKLSKISTTFCAWELPSEVNLSNHECHCGICLFREDLSKDALPEWVDLQLKKEMVLGFGILSNDLASLLCEPDEHGGFTLVRITSSGRFELQRYHASWSLARILEGRHEADLCTESHLLHPRSVKENKSAELHYLKLDYLRAYANGNLAQILTTKLDKAYSNDQEEAPFSLEVHELLCKKLNACGLGHSRSSPAITSIFNDVKLPASFHEVALRKLWTDLPLELLQLAFMSYSECREINGFNQTRVPLEFLAVPDLPQLPPFFSRKPSPHSDNDIVGPVIPFPALLVINEVRYGYSDLGSDGFSVEAELDLKYKEVMQVANEIAASSHSSMPPDDHAVSLAEENEDPWADSSKPKPFSTYRPIALTFSGTDSVQRKCSSTNNIYESFIFHVSEKSCKQTESESVGAEMFDDLCPIEMRFDAPEKKFEDQSLKAYTYLKKKMSRWHEEFDLY